MDTPDSPCKTSCGHVPQTTSASNFCAGRPGGGNPAGPEFFPRIPTFPARPVNGGRLELALPKRGRWLYEPKINGWRVLVHAPSGTCFNRHGERLSIEREFAPVLERTKAAWDTACADCKTPAFEWLDCEGLERRIPVGKGSLVLLDLPLHPGDYDTRMQAIYDGFIEGCGIAESWKHEHFQPPENELLTLAYVYAEDDSDTDMQPLAAWKRLKAANAALGCELFEGLVAKRRDSRYPVQLRRADEEFPGWMKHRWSF
jgi:hypothetical protein